MKRLTVFTLALLMLILTGCRRNRTVQYMRVPVDSAAVADTFTVDEPEDSWLDDDEGLIEIPDIPKERSVDMSANDYDLERVMMGRE